MPEHLNGGADRYVLTADDRMLLRMRDTLYEGCWDDFERDLRARAGGRPHVFDTIPETPSMPTTIATHLKLIAAMRAWEERYGRVLTPNEGD